MLIIIETVVIIAYMLNSYLGMGLMLVASFYILFFMKKGNKFYRLLELMVMALPLSYVGIAGISMHQLFSWYNVYLVIFLTAIFRYNGGRIPIKRNAGISTMIIVFCLLINMLWNQNMGDTLTEIAQILVMLIPLTVFHSVNDIPISAEESYSLLDAYSNVCFSTSIAMLFQYVAYRYAHLSIGILHYSGGGRVAYNCMFRGASILPIYMGIGIIFLVITCFEDKVTFFRLDRIVLIFIATVLNSSRTALFALMVIIALIVIKYLARRPSFKGMLIGSVGLVGSYFAIDYITTLRSGLTSFLDVNKRNITWENGLKIWTANLKNFLLGEGFAGGRWEGITKPHNLVIQTLAQCGVVVAFFVFAMLICFIWDNRKNPYVFMVLFVILSYMLVTDFYSNAFITVIFMLVSLNTKECGYQENNGFRDNGGELI